MTITLHGDPRTKKNSQRIIMVGGRRIVTTSKAYSEYRDLCVTQIPPERRIAFDGAVNVKCVYYMRTRRRVDLVNLLEATDDILVDAGVLKDDNSDIIRSHDGSRVYYDKTDPRVEITIDWMED